jgi:peptidoglycan/LPS O-acetylase OafA/YrhL
VIIAYLVVIALMSLRLPSLVAPWEFLATMLFARNYLMHWAGRATGQFWSLSVEEHFYLFWPPVLAFLGSRKALRAAIFGVMVVVAWRTVDSRYHLFARVFADAGVFYRSDTRCDALLAGAIGALACDQAKAFFGRFRSFPLTGCIFLVIVIAVAARAPLLASLLVVLFPLLILSTICRPTAFTGRWLERRPLRWVGRVSYSLYVWQTLFLQVHQVSFSWHAIHSSRARLAGAYLLDLGLIFVCAILSNKLVEGPLRRKGRELAEAGATSRIRTA